MRGVLLCRMLILLLSPYMKYYVLTHRTAWIDCRRCWTVKLGSHFNRRTCSYARLCACCNSFHNTKLHGWVSKNMMFWAWLGSLLKLGRLNVQCITPAPLQRVKRCCCWEALCFFGWGGVGGVKIWSYSALCPKKVRTATFWILHV